MKITWLRPARATAWDCLYACLWIFRSNIEDQAWAIWTERRGIVVSGPGPVWYSPAYRFEDRWCYHSYDAAKAALDAWDGEGKPTGWHRDPASGLKRPDGDLAREKVRW